MTNEDAAERDARREHDRSVLRIDELSASLDALLAENRRLKASVADIEESAYERGFIAGMAEGQEAGYWSAHAMLNGDD